MIWLVMDCGANIHNRIVGVILVTTVINLNIEQIICNFSTNFLSYI